jgi:hypothetical protein
MDKIKLEEIKRIILGSINKLVSLAGHQGDRHAQGALLAQGDSLRNLGARIDLRQLPDGFVRSLVNDVRLDTLMIMADLKVALTFKKQVLQDTIMKPVAFGTQKKGAVDDVEGKQELDQVVSDLQVLTAVEESLRCCMMQA